MLLVVVNGKKYLLAFKDLYVGVVTLKRHALLKVRYLETKARMAFVSLQGGNRYQGKTAQTSINESDSVHASPVILQTYASSSTVRTMSREQ